MTKAASPSSSHPSGAAWHENRERRGTGAYLEGNEDAEPPKELQTAVRNRNGTTTSRYLFDLAPDEQKRYEEIMIGLQTNGGVRKAGRGPRFDNLGPRKKTVLPMPPPKPDPVPQPDPPSPEAEIVAALIELNRTDSGRDRLRALGRLVGEGGAAGGPSAPARAPRPVSHAPRRDTGHGGRVPGAGAPAAVARAS